MTTKEQAISAIQSLIDGHKIDTKGECELHCDIVTGMEAALDAVVAIANVTPVAKPTYAELSVEFETLLGHYWDIAYAEFKSGVNGSEAANKTLHKLRALLRRAVG